jgi:hypothetical protein
VSQDLRYATRRLRRGRAPAVAAVLALGVGVNLAVFSVIHASLLQPLPHPAAGSAGLDLVAQLESGREHLTAPLDFFDFEQRASAFARMAAYYPPGFTLTGGEQAERVSGAAPAPGSSTCSACSRHSDGFTAAEDRAGAAIRSP